MLELCGERATLRTVVEGDLAALRRIVRTPEVARWWQPGEDWSPDSDAEATALTVLVDGEVAGLIQFEEELEPDYRQAAIDLFLAPERHGRGLGTEVLGTLVRHLVDARGHHRLTIDPAVENEAAVRCYAKAGFRTVGTMRSSWFDHTAGGWRDALMMELVRPAE